MNAPDAPGPGTHGAAAGPHHPIVHTGGHAHPPAPVAGRRERNRIAVEGRIRAAALALFREKGYEQTTVEEIADRADVSKATVFNYFPRKEALVDALAAAVWQQAEAALGRPAARARSSRHQIRWLLVTLLRLAEADRALFRVLLHQTVREFWIDSQDDPVSRSFNRALRDILETGRARGDIDRRVRGESAARLIEQAFVGVMIDWLASDAPLVAARREIDAQLRIVFEGLAARTGTS